nr:hypothetical protein [Moraxella osloensis]
MNQNQSIPYNQVDFVVKAPRFRIVFSYMDDKGIAFVREYLLRLLKLTACKADQIAQYFGFNQHETEVALTDLEQNKWIMWRDDGLIQLSAEGLRLFQNSEKDTPKIPTLKESRGEYRIELLDNNFLERKHCDKSRQQAIELAIEPKVLSASEEIARKTFQNLFRQLIEDGIINMEENDISLYKIDVIEPKGSPDYFRFTQNFEFLPETGESKERHDIKEIIHQENIQQAITSQIEQFSNGENLRELRKSMDELNDEDTSKVLFGGKLDFTEFLSINQKYEEKNGSYFLGQIYHQAKENKKFSNKALDDVEEIIKKSKKGTSKLYWIAPSDIYWGKQLKIHDKIQNLFDLSKDKFEFRLYLPLPNERNKHEKREWINQFKDIPQKILYGFHEGFLDGNTEVLFLEDKFAIVCYHAKLPNYPVTVPIGFMTTELTKVNQISKTALSYLSSLLFNNNSDFTEYKDFGLLSN